MRDDLVGKGHRFGIRCRSPPLVLHRLNNGWSQDIILIGSGQDVGLCMQTKELLLKWSSSFYEQLHRSTDLSRCCMWEPYCNSLVIAWHNLCCFKFDSSQACGIDVFIVFLYFSLLICTLKWPQVLCSVLCTTLTDICQVSTGQCPYLLLHLSWFES